MSPGQGYIERIVDPLISEYLGGLPAVMLVGPRATGKTTTAMRHGRSVLRLDRPAAASAIRSDPDDALASYDEPVVIDEWQLVPEVLGAVKRSVDTSPGSGRFILTGSSAADLTTAGWAATGRVVRIPVWGLTERELGGSPASTPFVSRLFAGDVSSFDLPSDIPSARGYVDLALRSGFPELVHQSSERLRRAWLASYVDQLVGRDLDVAGSARDPVRLRRYLRVVATNTAGNPLHKTLYEAAEITRTTATAYDSALQGLMIVDHVPAWTGSRLGRLASTPKRYITDTGLLVPLLGIDQRAVLRDGDLLGRVIDTFVTAQLRAELAVCDEAPRLFHLREVHGRSELDLVIEAADGRVVGIEIKADAAPPASAAKHLIQMRDRLGDRFAYGVVLHTGPRPFNIAERISALPICAIWGRSS
jgi:uncharacterized protein